MWADIQHPQKALSVLSIQISHSPTCKAMFGNYEIGSNSPLPWFCCDVVTGLSINQANWNCIKSSNHNPGYVSFIVCPERKTFKLFLQDMVYNFSLILFFTWNILVQKMQSIDDGSSIILISHSVLNDSFCGPYNAKH